MADTRTVEGETGRQLLAFIYDEVDSTPETRTATIAGIAAARKQSTIV